MRTRSGAFLLNTIGLLVAAAIAAAAASPAWSEEAPGGSPEETITLTITDEGIMGAEPIMINGEPADVRGEQHGAEEGGNLGFPQLDASSYPSQIFWLIVAFAAMYTLMSKIALPRITEVLDMRQSQKDGNLGRAAQMQEEATKIKTAYEAELAKAQESAQSTLASAEQDIAERLAAENSKFAEQSRKRVAAAETAIAKAKDDARASLADISADIAVDMVTKITAVQINKADAKKVVVAAMQKGA